VSLYFLLIVSHPNPLGTPAGMAASPPAASPPAAKSTLFSLRLAVIMCLQTSHSSLPVAMAYFGAMNFPDPNLYLKTRVSMKGVDDREGGKDRSKR